MPRLPRPRRRPAAKVAVRVAARSKALVCAMLSGGKRALRFVETSSGRPAAGSGRSRALCCAMLSEGKIAMRFVETSLGSLRADTWLLNMFPCGVAGPMQGLSRSVSNAAVRKSRFGVLKFGL